MLERSFLVISKVLTLLVHWYLVILEVILGLGFILLLFGASPSSAFTRWIYRSLQQAMSPFDGMFQQIDLGTNGQVDSVVDVSILFAMVVYGLFLVLVDRILDYLTRSLRRYDYNQQVDEQDQAYTQASSYTAPPPNVIGEATTRPASQAAGGQAARQAPAPAPGDQGAKQ